MSSNYPLPGLPGYDHASPERVARGMLRMGAVGAMVGIMAAGASNVRKVQDGTMKREEAVRDALLTGAKTGVATGVGTGLASLIGHGPVLPLATMLLAGTAILYGLNRMPLPGRRDQSQS